MTLKAIVILGMGTFGLTLWNPGGTTAAATAAVDPLAEIYQRAKNEGVVSIWSLNAEEMRWIPAAFEKSSEKNHKLALHVDVNDPEVMKLALNNARNAHDLYTEWGEKVAIEIVAYSQGFHMLREDTSPVKERIKLISETSPSISFAACGNTRANMSRTEKKEIPLISQATVVSSGVVRVMELQEQGWSYVRP